MLRTIFVFGIILAGVIYAFQGPFYILNFYLWNAYFRPEQWMWVDYVSPLKLSFVLAIAVLLTSIPAIARFRLTPLVVLMLLFLAQSTLSLVASEHFDWSYYFWIEFVKVAVIALLITILVTDRRQYRLTLLVIGLSLGLETAKQGWAQLVLNPGATNNNPHPMLGDNNGVAVGMMMLVPVFVALAQTAARRWERYLYRFLIVGLVYRGVSTYSRGGLLAAAALGIIMFWRSPKKFRALIAVGVLVTVVLGVMPQEYWDRMNTITVSEDQQDSSARGRLYFWTVAVRMAAAKPVTGIGFNGFRQSFPSYDTSGGFWGGDRAVHSAWFGVLAEMGYPGLILLVGNLVVAFLTCWRIRRSARGDPDLKDFRAYAGAMQGTLVAYAVGVTFLNGQYHEMFWHMLGMTVALDGAYALARQRVDSRVAAPAPGVPPRQAHLPRKDGVAGPYAGAKA
jgi:probable O-glycosylation ligase (exosortase A-associated)